MCPEYNPKNNTVRMLKGERIEGQGGELKGQAALRLEYLADMIGVSHSGSGTYVYVPGTSYKDVLNKIIEDSRPK